MAKRSARRCSSRQQCRNPRHHSNDGVIEVSEATRSVEARIQVRRPFNSQTANVICSKGQTRCMQQAPGPCGLGVLPLTLPACAAVECNREGAAEEHLKGSSRSCRTAQRQGRHQASPTQERPPCAGQGTVSRIRRCEHWCVSMEFLLSS
jgi:hypothetical protein